MTFQMISKILKYFGCTAIDAFLKVPFVPSGTVFPKNWALCLKDLKLLSLAISTSCCSEIILTIFY